MKLQELENKKATLAVMVRDCKRNANLIPGLRNHYEQMALQKQTELNKISREIRELIDLSKNNKSLHNNVIGK